MDAPSSTESSLFEGFRLDRRAGVLFRRDERGVSLRRRSVRARSTFSACWLNGQGISSREPRSWRPSGRVRRSKTAT